MSEQLVLEWRHASEHYRTPGGLRAQGLVFSGIGLLLFVAALILFSPDSAGSFAARLLLNARQASMLTWFVLGAAFLLLLAEIAGRRVARRRRLVFSPDTLSFVSGLPPWLNFGAWRSWSLAYGSIDGVSIESQVIGKGSRDPLALAELRLRGSGISAIRPLSLAHWFRPGELPRTRLKSDTSEFALIRRGRWSSESDKNLLEQRFDGLPVVVALRAHGVLIPPFSSGKPVVADIDLLADGRMKAVFVAFFACITLSFVGLLTAPEVWVLVPSAMIWVGLDFAGALAAFVWMRRAPASAETAGIAPAQLSQGRAVVAFLFGISAGFAAYPALLWLGFLLLPQQELRYQVSARHRLEPVQLGIDAPSLPLPESEAFAASHPPGSEIHLPMRRGLFGLWQYDDAVIRERIKGR